jgi:hypothetical protein
MKRLALTALVMTLLVRATPATAHPVPFSYLDVQLRTGTVEISLVAHIFDVAHDLHVDPAERLLDPAFLAEHRDAIVALLAPRLRLEADRTALTPESWSIEAAADRQSVRLRARSEVRGSPGAFSVDVRMFPYDPAHQTFVNVYEGDDLTLQAILDQAKTRLDYFPGSRQGAFAVARRFVPSGIRHVIAGPDHLIFLFGLLLLGGTTRHRVLIAGALASGDALAFLLTVFNVLHPPARIIEPAIALGMVYVGADNLMVRGGRDMRVWIALAFGLIHGSWFANGLRGMDLPARALNWSLLSFDVGVELAQILVIFVVSLAVAWLSSKNPTATRRLVYTGSAFVILSGAYWFVQRVFFPGGFV